LDVQKNMAQLLKLFNLEKKRVHTVVDV